LDLDGEHVSFRICDLFARAWIVCNDNMCL
jgi:hypothetical protein